jgi:hypothetical protein
VKHIIHGNAGRQVTNGHASSDKRRSGAVQIQVLHAVCPRLCNDRGVEHVVDGNRAGHRARRQSDYIGDRWDGVGISVVGEDRDIGYGGTRGSVVIDDADGEESRSRQSWQRDGKLTRGRFGDHDGIPAERWPIRNSRHRS